MLLSGKGRGPRFAVIEVIRDQDLWVSDLGHSDTPEGSALPGLPAVSLECCPTIVSRPPVTRHPMGEVGHNDFSTFGSKYRNTAP